jgi:NarL family two-component system response regulator LiaR
MLQRTAPGCDSTLPSLYAAEAVKTRTPGFVGVYAIDEQALFRRGLAAMLASESAYGWVGEAGSVAEALLVAHMARPDVVLVDLQLPDMDGVAAIGALQTFWPGARYVVLTSRCDAVHLQPIVAAGASCLLKNLSPLELMEALREIRSGRQVLSPAVVEALASSALEAPLGHDLTPREHALLQLMAQGLDNRSISTLMEISVPTVKFHVTNVMSKLRAANRTAAVLVALRKNIVRLDDAVAIELR